MAQSGYFLRFANTSAGTIAGVGASTQGLFPDGAYTIQLAGTTLRGATVNTPNVGSIAGPKAKIINASVIQPTSTGSPQWAPITGIGGTSIVEVGTIDDDGYMTVHFSSY